MDYLLKHIDNVCLKMIQLPVDGSNGQFNYLAKYH